MIDNLIRLGTLVLESGWNGGQWKVDGKNLNSANLPNTVKLEIGGRKVDARPVSFDGSDYDHGHRYQWSNIDFSLKLKTPIGQISKSLRELLRERKRTVVLYMEK